MEQNNTQTQEQKQRTPLFAKDQIPATFEQAVKAKWGNEIEASPARSNGSYAGPVVADGNFIAQKVSDKSVVFHQKDAIDFKSNDHLVKRNDEGRLNDVQLSIRYDGEKSKAFFHDPQRAAINVMFNRIEKGAEAHMDAKALDTFKEQLGKIKESMIEKQTERKNEAFEKRTQHTQTAKREAGAGLER